MWTKKIYLTYPLFLPIYSLYRDVVSFHGGPYKCSATISFSVGINAILRSQYLLFMSLYCWAWTRTCVYWNKKFKTLFCRQRNKPLLSLKPLQRNHIYTQVIREARRRHPRSGRKGNMWLIPCLHHLHGKEIWDSSLVSTTYRRPTLTMDTSSAPLQNFEKKFLPFHTTTWSLLFRNR